MPIDIARVAWSVCLSMCCSVGHIHELCSKAVRDWYLSNNLLMNADKSEVIVLGTANQLRFRRSGWCDATGSSNPEVTRRHSGSVLDVR